MKFMHMPLFLVADIGSTVSLAEVRRHFLSGSRRYRGCSVCADPSQIQTDVLWESRSEM